MNDLVFKKYVVQMRDGQLELECYSYRVNRTR